MHGAIALHPTPHKGTLPLRSRRHVGVIAIGNALGNSFVANRMDAEQTRLDAQRASAAMSEQATKAVNAKLDAQLATTSNTAMTNVAAESQAQTERMLQALAYNRALDLNEVEAAQSAKRTDQTLARIEAVNAQSAALQNHANDMQQHFDASMKYRQESTDFALKEALARGGNAAFTGQKRQDLMAGVDVEGYINFRQGQRDAYEQSWVGKTTSAVSDFSATISDMVGDSYDFYFGDNGAFEKAFDVTKNALALTALKLKPVKSNTLSFSVDGSLRNIVGGGITLNAGVQSDGVIGLAISGDGFFKFSEQHFKEGSLTLSGNSTFQHWKGANRDATLKNIFSGYSTYSGYDVTAFKYDIGWQNSSAWVDKPFFSPLAVEGSGLKLGVDIFGKADKYTFPFEASTGIEHQIGDEVHTLDAGVIGRWLYWFTR